MKKNVRFIIFGVLLIMVFTSAMLSNPNAPTGKTGAPKAGTTSGASSCTSCHGDFTLNSSGTVVATGLPTSTYIAGQSYNFSIKITYPIADRLVWGFAIKAVNTTNNNIVGTFTTTNANASVKGSIATNTQELSHSSAATTAATTTYTYTNLKWTAPITPGVNDASIKFYITGVAGDGSGNESGDYVVTSTVAATLGTTPVTLSTFNCTKTTQNNVLVKWQTQQELNTAYFEVQRSVDGNNWLTIAKMNAVGNSSVTQNYSYIDNSTSLVNGQFYYRINTVDVNGISKTSSINTVANNNKNATEIICTSAMPLKAGSLVNYKVNASTAQNMNIKMVDISGKIISAFTKQLAVGSNTIQIATPANKGVYLIKFASQNFEKTVKQIVQ